MFTRQDYMDKKCSHSEYYGQFVNESIKRFVKNAIGIEKIKNSNDEHFNDIPLILWDKLSDVTKTMIPVKLWKEAESPQSPPGFFTWSLSSNICILKEAARQIKSELTQKSQSTANTNDENIPSKKLKV